ncbi:MAG: RNA methyltransferase [Burkholderiales bacterium]|nr:RNA methyltransferase [Burkholderiales bacterium]
MCAAAAARLITSRDNPLYRRLKALGSSAQARKKEGLSVLDGAHLVEACLARGWRPELVAVGESALRRAEVARLAAGAGGDVPVFADALFESLSNVEHGAGILAAVRTPRAALPDAITGDCLFLEHLQDPGNMGSLLRSAAAAGVGLVVCSPRTVYAWSPKVLRAGQGAHFRLEIVEGVDLEAARARLRVPLLATTVHGGETLYGVDLAGPVAWLFGNEGAGVSPEMAARADRRVVIPMPGQSESLNVAAAGAVCLFEAVRQRRAPGSRRC